jgi:hypothetical protein
MCRGGGEVSQLARLRRRRESEWSRWMVLSEDVRKVMEGMWAGHGVASSNFRCDDLPTCFLE